MSFDNGGSAKRVYKYCDCNAYELWSGRGPRNRVRDAESRTRVYVCTCTGEVPSFSAHDKKENII